MYHNIPKELQELPQWIVWRLEDIGAKKPTKVPYDVKTGKLASVTESETWATFDEAVKALSDKFHNYDGIGFVFTVNDPYSFIDLDDTEGDQLAMSRQIEIAKEFDSYSEVSPSGKGLHIIVKGSVPTGRRRNFIEVYSSHRYATFTGNIHNNKPINDCQAKLHQLWEQMGSGQIATHLYTGDNREKCSDEEIIRRASEAVNGDKFRALVAGKWQDLYPSQSEADFALVDIFAFYTQNRNQIIRLFRNSALGKRDKAKRQDYLVWMINKSFDRMLPPIDFDGFRIELEKKLAGTSVSFVSEPGKPSNLSDGTIPLPPGLVGEIARFIYAAAPRPIPEAALAGSLGLMAGVAGRAYNVSGTGLNQYILFLGMTGIGKAAISSGIDKLMNAIRFQVPTSSNFVGPSEIASGQALIKYLGKYSQSFVSIFGEFGLRLESMCDPRSNSSDRSLRRHMLDLYNKSGYGEVFRPSVFADAEKNISATDNPNFSIIAESTPDTFYNVLNENMIADGFLPRFSLIEYKGIRPPSNKGHNQVKPSLMLIDKFSALVASAEHIMRAKKVVNVGFDPEAERMHEAFDRFCDDQINNASKEILRQLWNRAHIKVLKIAALIAVGVNMADPIVSPEYVQWAINLVHHDIETLSNKFEDGEIGTHSFEIKQLRETTRMIGEFISREWDYCKKYCQGKNTDKLHQEKVIPYSYLCKRLLPVASFRLDRSGGMIALKRALQTLLDSDKIREINKQELAVKYGTSQRAFIVSDVSLLGD